MLGSGGLINTLVFLDKESQVWIHLMHIKHFKRSVWCGCSPEAAGRPGFVGILWFHRVTCSFLFNMWLLRPVSSANSSDCWCEPWLAASCLQLGVSIGVKHNVHIGVIVLRTCTRFQVPAHRSQFTYHRNSSRLLSSIVRTNLCLFARINNSWIHTQNDSKMNRPYFET